MFPRYNSWNISYYLFTNTHFFYRKKNTNKEQINNQQINIALVGHHPTCDNFSVHVIRFGNKTYCAGCTGLVLGAILSLIGILSYAFFNFVVGTNIIIAFWIGFFTVALGLTQNYIPYRRMGSVHFLLNLVFVLGAFLLFIGINEITNNFNIEVYFLILIFFWITTRIMTSQIEHKKICATCKKSCQYF